MTPRRVMIDNSWAYRAGWWEGRADGIRTVFVRLLRAARRHPELRKSFEVREAAKVANKLNQRPPWERKGRR